MKLVFVSSTFVDMQAERDLLHTHIAPYLDNALVDYGEKVHFGDLRWGIDTSELKEAESNKKILNACLDEIDGCKPYMICFIGERYGWIPETILMKEAALLKGVEIKKDMSVTELEIEYGALIHPDYEGRILFYFRELDKTGMPDNIKKLYEAESPLHKEKIEALKKRIKEKYPNLVRTYKAKWDNTTQRVVNLDDFEKQVETDLLNIFQKDMGSYNNLCWEEKAILNAERRYLDNAKYYVEFSKQSFAKPVREEQHVFLINGGERSGKTFYLSHLYSEFKNRNQNNDVILVPFINQLDKYTQNPKSLIGLIIYKIRESLGNKGSFDVTNISMNELIDDCFIPLLKRCNKRIYVIADDCDEAIIKMLFRLYDTYSVKGISSFASHYEKMDLFFAYKNTEEPLVTIPGLDRANIITLPNKLEENMVIDYINSVTRFSHKEFPAQLSKFISEQRMARDTRYINVLIDRLLLLDSNDFQEINANNEGTKGFTNYCMNLVYSRYKDTGRIEDDLLRIVVEKIDEPFIVTLLTILAYGRVALTKEEIKEAFSALGMKFDELKFSLSLRMLHSFIHANNDKGEYRIHPSSAWTIIGFLEKQKTNVLEKFVKYVLSSPKGSTLFKNRYIICIYAEKSELAAEVAYEALTRTDDRDGLIKAQVARNIAFMARNEGELGGLYFNDVIDICKDIDMSLFVRMIPIRHLNKVETKKIGYFFDAVIGHFEKESGLTATQRELYAYILMRKAVYDAFYVNRDHAINDLSKPLIIASGLHASRTATLVYLEYIKLVNEIGESDLQTFGLRPGQDPFKLIMPNNEVSTWSAERLVEFMDDHRDMDAMDRYYHEVTRCLALAHSGRLLWDYSNVVFEPDDNATDELVYSGNYLRKYLNINNNIATNLFTYEDYIEIFNAIAYSYSFTCDQKELQNALTTLNNAMEGKASSVKAAVCINHYYKFLSDLNTSDKPECVAKHVKTSEVQILTACLLDNDVEYSLYLKELGWSLVPYTKGVNDDKRDYYLTQLETYIKYVTYNAEENPMFFYDAYYAVLNYVKVMRKVNPQKCVDTINFILNEMMQDKLYPLLMQVFLNHMVVVSGFGNNNHINGTINAYNQIMRDKFYHKMVDRYKYIFEDIRQFYS